VITRATAADGRWREVPRSGNSWWGTAIELFLRDRLDPELVLVAPKRSRAYRQVLEDMRLLRETGVAEPD
jgi:hypothetical protein